MSVFHKDPHQHLHHHIVYNVFSMKSLIFKMENLALFSDINLCRRYENKKVPANIKMFI